MSPWLPTLANMAACSDAESDGVSDEIELLTAIYVNELEIHGPEERPSLVNLFLHPSTGDDHNSKYVCLNLLLTISEKYPFLSPGISIKNPRGLSDAHVASIQDNLIALAEEKIGTPMLYDLIEYAKECLSDNNIPSCPCVICLEHFGREEKFVKTECYHYFHVVCLVNYVDHFLIENGNTRILCPMCRVEISYNKDDHSIEKNNSFTEEIFVYKPDKKQLRAQAERQKIFEYQKLKGGIINIEEERKKYLIGIKDRKNDESESNDLQSHMVPIPVEVPQKTVDSLGGVARQNLGRNEGQACRIADKEERSYDKNKARVSSRSSLRKDEGSNDNVPGIVTESQSTGQAFVRDALPRKRSSDGQRRTERNDSRVSRGQKQLGEGREDVEERGSRKAEISRKERNSKRKDQKVLNQAKENKVVGSLEQESTKSRGKEDAFPSGAKHGEQEGKEECPSKKNGNSHPDSQKKCQLSSEGQAKEKDVRLSSDAKDGEKKEKDLCQTSQLKLSTTSFKPSAQKGNIESKSHKEYSSLARNCSNNSLSKQIPGGKQQERKQNDRNESQRKARGGRTSTPRRPQEGSKNYKQGDEKKCQKSYSSVASGTKQAESSVRKDQKRSDSPFSENNNKSGNKSGKAFSPKVGGCSSNVDENVVNNDRSNSSIRRPPPGFENVKPAVVGESLERRQKVAPREATQPVHNDPNTTKAKPPRRKPPPGFENMKQSVKKL